MKNWHKIDLEKKLAYFNGLIGSYEPSTKWEAANNRTLKRLVSKRNKLEKILEKYESESS